MANLRLTPLLALLGLLLTACPSANTQAKGQLEVTVNIPTGSGITPNVQVSGPGGFSQTISQEGVRLFDQASVGNYTITAQDVIAAGDTYKAKVSVGSAPGTSNTASAAVTANTKTSVTVDYTQAPPSGAVNPEKTFTATLGIGSLVFLSSSGDGQGRLYASGNAANKNTPSGRLYLTPANLAGSGGAVPSVQIAPEDGLYSLIFAGDGTLYELDRNDLPPTPSTYIRRFARATAVANGFSPTPLVITNGAFSFSTGSGTIQDYNLYKPSDMALDSAGNLWVLDPESTARSSVDGISNTPGRLVCYSAADQTAAIAGSGSLNTPGRVYYGTAISGARALAFDASGNLWLAGGSGASARLVRIASYTCPNLPTSGPNAGNPDNQELNLNSAGVSSLSGDKLVAPVDLAVAGTDLYVAQSDGTTNNILKLSTSATAIPNDIVPITIIGLEGSLTGLAVDAEGKLWVGTAGAPAPNPGRIYKLP
ncbi:hypothetical protein [Meiothermus sp. CFH 77666]|uniref:hypothetical protein n=1 Tax=Meiothermus sp. CFH 77666 TaxID=2817942 RepID=UPI001AA07F3E|nr:hypothetical protein [Meiothermus sp. CFH 77666]MBO1435612.1 hypothetical protein [Meiothermus sp. CFH 77666]